MSFKRFIIQLAFMAFFVLLVFVGIMFWLRVYTNHGQKLTLPDYVNQNFEDAFEDANKNSFTLVINDSIHIIGRSGGEIISQYPEAGNLVKENRKIYVDVTKYNPDVIKLNDLDALYGMEYNSKVLQLSYLKLNSRIKGYKFDAGEPNHILEVWYKGEQVVSASGRKKDVNIEKGSTLEFVLSKRSGGQTEIPDLACKTLSMARFILDARQLRVGRITKSGEIENMEEAFIVSQQPEYVPGQRIEMDGAVNFIIQQAKPADCP